MIKPKLMFPYDYGNSISDDDASNNFKKNSKDYIVIYLTIVHLLLKLNHFLFCGFGGSLSTV